MCCCCCVVLKHIDFEWVPLVIVKSVENFHVQNGRNNGSKSDHRKCDKLFRNKRQGVTTDL